MVSAKSLLLRLVLLTMALAVAPVAVWAQVSDTSHEVTFTAGGGKSTFAFRWNRGMIFVPIRLNGSPPLSFVLDTGSTRTIVDRAVATSLGLKTSGSSSLQGAGAGRIPIEFIHDVSVTLPGIESAGYELSTADLRPLEASLGIRVDGILAYELFSRFPAGNLSRQQHCTSNPDRATRQMGFCESRAGIARTGYRTGQLLG
jgi:hypothetical protein